ncbi:MAG: hypothetical protein LAO30_09250 [Acidobacteriia bacterium]|nr:hypothetical protein [Terriglobia bacterium]
MPSLRLGLIGSIARTSICVAVNFTADDLTLVLLKRLYRSDIRIDLNLVMGKVFPESCPFRFEQPRLKFSIEVSRLTEDVPVLGCS